MNSSEFAEHAPQNGDSTMAHGPSVKKSPYVSAKRSFSEHKTLENLPETESYVEDEVPENLGSEIALARQNSFTSFLTFENATFENTSMNDDGGSWVCPNCSYNNVDAGSNSCALCGAAKVIMPPNEKPPPQAYQEFEDNHVPQPKHFENPQENLADPAAGRLVPQYSSSIHMNHMNTSSSSILDRKKSPRRLVAEDDDSGLRPVEAPKRTDDRKMPANPSNHFELRKQASDGLNPPVQHRKSNPDATEQEFTDAADFEHYDVEAAAASEGTAPSSNEHDAVPQPRETQPVQQTREAPVIGKDTGLFGSRKRRMIFAAIALVVLVGIAVGVTVPLVTKDSGSSGATPSPSPPTDTTPVPVAGTEPPGSPTTAPADPTQPASPTAMPETSSPSPPTPAPTFSAVTARYDSNSLDGEDSFGSAVSMSENALTVAVSTPRFRKVQVFRRLDQGLEWAPPVEIAENNGVMSPDKDPLEPAGNQTEKPDGRRLVGDFGHVMAMSRDGEWLAIGAEDYVQLYNIQENGFEPRGRIEEVKPQSLDISNGQKPRCAIASTNSVRTYERNPTSGNWDRSPDLELPVGTPERKSISMSSSGRFVALGLPAGGDERPKVAVYQYKYANNEWRREGAVFSEEIDHDKDSESPPSVSISGDEKTVAVGFLEPFRPPQEAAQVRGRVQVYRNGGGNKWELISDNNDNMWYGVSGSNQLVSISNDGNLVAFNADRVRVLEYDEEGWKLRVNGTEADIATSDALFLAGNEGRFAIGTENEVHVFKIPDDTPLPTTSPTVNPTTIMPTTSSAPSSPPNEMPSSAVDSGPVGGGGGVLL